MKPIEQIFLFVLFYFFSLPTNVAQVKGEIFARTNALHKGFAPYPSIIQRDIMWSKRIWRTMDLKEKMNHPYFYPTESFGNMHSLFNIIRNNIKASELMVYDVIDDEFTIPLTKTAAETMGDKTETFYVDDPETEMPQEVEVPNPVHSEDVKRFRIKEEWFFDKQRSVLEVRIIGICPVLEMFDDNGDYKGELPMYWVYFPEIRPILARYETVNRWNDAERRTYDDLFLKRFFSSYIYKESNVYNRKISEYKLGLDALLEADKIHDKVANFEQDLWHY